MTTIRTLSEIRPAADKSNSTLRWNRTLADAGIRGGLEADRGDSVIGKVASYGLAILLGAGAASFALHRPDPAELIAMPAQERPMTERLGCPDQRPGLSKSIIVLAETQPDGSLASVQCQRMRERGKGKPRV